MWKWLHPYAKPEQAYRLAGRLLPWFAVISLLAFIIGTVWGLAFAPADYQQGDSFRIIYLHVPAAILSMGAYSTMAIAAFIGMVWQLRMADMTVAAIAPVGAVFTFIALFTGAAWGKPMWGAWWVWDARLTSELILLFLYLGVIALYNAFSDKVVAGRAAGILALVGVINLPIIHYSVEWWNTLHQGASITKFAKPSIAPSMLWPLLVMIVAFATFLGALTLMRFRNELIMREWHRPWVKALAEQER
ncbi:heme ABC transporter permease [Aeromonas rivuli]|jgi:heme exporter protein C|uniref:heme ABC transporter permease n=1 Tax=Aeromonas TaxID=642 RepID=UPI0005AACCE4|nr:MULTISPECIES: heme ABC transporter permease [Aeromonas]MCS3458334.1 heme exporter protein C [Aeromonas sp. BIGb0445]UBO72910.1 heme ABC transporter permease [Aeromonas rivuli]